MTTPASDRALGQAGGRCAGPHRDEGRAGLGSALIRHPLCKCTVLPAARLFLMGASRDTHLSTKAKWEREKVLGTAAQPGGWAVGSQVSPDVRMVRTSWRSCGSRESGVGTEPWTRVTPVPASHSLCLSLAEPRLPVCKPGGQAGDPEPPSFFRPGPRTHSDRTPEAFGPGQRMLVTMTRR